MFLPNRKLYMVQLKKYFRNYIPLFITIFVLLSSSVVISQTETEQPKKQVQRLKLTGDFGLYNEQYSISGREKRRPSSTQRLFFNPSLALFGSLKLDFRFVLSSEGNSAKQDINQFDINPRWSWGKINAGDFSLTYSPLTVSGIKIRGGAIDLFPGKFRFAVFGGTSQREVITFDKQQSFKREIYGGRIGVGKNNKSHFHLTVLKAEDIFNSIEEIVIDTTGMADSSFADSNAIPAITPKENLVAAINTRLDLYQGKFVFNAEVSGSAYSRDLTASELNPDEVPSGVDNVFTLNTSSAFDYAYITDFKLNLKKIKIITKYSYIGPGYVSLGVASLQNDVKSFGVGFTYRFKRTMIRVNTNFQTDNLIGQKLYTTDRNRYSLNLNFRASRKWNISNSINFSSMKNDASSDNLSLDYTALVLRTGHRISLSKGKFRSLSFDYTFQKSKDANQLRSSSQLDSHSGSIGLQLNLSRSISLSPSVKILMNKQGGNGRRTTATYSLAGRHYAAKKKLITSLRLSLSSQDESDNLRGSLKSKYSFEQLGSLGIEFSYNKFDTDIINSTSFDESFVKIRYSKSF